MWLVFVDDFNICEEDLNTTCEEDLNKTCEEDSNTTREEDSNTTCKGQIWVDTGTLVESHEVRFYFYFLIQCV